MRRMSEARRGAFLKALAATGNVTLAAERACVSRSWVLLARKAEPEFDSACAAALDSAADRLGAQGSRRPPAGWGHLDGVQLVVRGSNGRRVQIARARAGQISAAVEDRFLAVLAATCNVDAARRAIGVSKSAIYTHRLRWPAFAKRWDEAIELGSARLEFGLLEHCGNIFSSPELPRPDEMPPMRIDDIFHNLWMHQHQTHGLGRRPGLPPREVTGEEAVRSLLAKVETIKRAKALGEELKASDREEWARRRAAQAGDGH